jgi:membrane-associated phospholipid phosphatase
LIATSLKYTVGRARPTEKVGAYDFEPFGGNDSFCSGHTTEAFVLASVISEHYPHVWVQLSTYTLASMVGYARLNNNRHWSSDVLAGAAVGTFVGKTIVQFNQKHRQASIEPILTPDMRGAMVSINW